MATTGVIVPRERIERYIFLIRGQKIMLSTHLADLYGVEPRALIQAVRRNVERFPKDFMFQLTQAEWHNLKSQIVISSWGGLRRATPYAFTEQGVAMLSTVLRSKRAVRVNIEISCGPLSACVECSPRTKSWRANSLLWKRNTTPSLRWSLMRFENSWRHRLQSAEKSVFW